MKRAVEVERVGDLLRITAAWACERCELIFVGEHFSADHCNATGNDVQLCEDCCKLANSKWDTAPLTITREHGLWVAKRDGVIVGEATTAAMLGAVIDEQAVRP